MTNHNTGAYCYHRTLQMTLCAEPPKPDALPVLAFYVVPAELTSHRGMVSPLLISASVLLPGGFFLGGCFIYAGDPGLGVWLVPVGALCLFTCVLLMAIGLVRTQAFTAETVEDAEQKTKRKRRRG